MQSAKTTGMKPRTTDDVSNANNRCHCGREADGVDARSRQPTCRDCAAALYSNTQFICDGGTSWFDLTGFQRSLLREIYRMDQPSGQAVKERIEALTGQHINHGRLYPNLDTLVDSQLVEKGSQDRRTNYYEVTNDGRRLVEQTAREFEKATSAVATDGGEADE